MKMVTTAFLWHSFVILLVSADPSWIDDTFHQGLYENCPFTNFHDRALDVKVNATWRPCCSSCVSDPTCGRRAPCCPDYDVKLMTSTCMVMLYALMPDDLYNDFKTLEKNYWVVETCLPEHHESLIETYCSARDVVSVFNTTSIQPVLDTETNVIYANRYCATCNNVHAANIATDMFTPVIKCLADTPAVNVLTSFAEINYFIQIGLCYITFQPESPDVVYPSMCLPYDVTSCNESKFWDVYDESIDNACQSYELAYTSSMNYFTYKNIHCYYCNTGSRHISVEGACAYPGFALVPSTFSAILGSLEGHKVVTGPELTSNSNFNGGDCPATQFYDPYKNECREIICPVTKTKTGSGCRRHLQSLQGIVWRIDVLWTIEDSEILRMTGFENTLATYAVEYMEDRLFHPYDDIFNLLELSVHVGKASNDSARVLISCRFLHDTDGATGPAMNFINENTIGTSEEHHINETIVKVMPRCINGESISAWRPEVVVFQVRMSRFYSYVSNKRFDHMRTPITMSKTLSCNLVLLEESEYNETEDGLLVLNNSKLIMSDVNYFKDESGVRICVSDYLDEESKKKPDKQSDQILVKWTVTLVLILVCIMGLCVFLVTYLLHPSIQSPTGHLYTCICVSMIISQSLQHFGVGRTNNEQTCKVIGVLAHFFALTTPLLMLGCSFHAHRQLWRLKLCVALRCSKRRLVRYCLVCAALTALIIVALHILLSLAHTNMVNMGYGGLTCEITRTLDRYYFLLLPIAIVLLSSVIVLISNLSSASSGNDSKQSSDPRTKFYSKTLLVLSILAAAYWVCEGLYWWLEWEGLEYISVVMDAAQGICLMAAYFVNQPVLALYGKLCSHDKPEAF